MLYTTYIIYIYIIDFYLINIIQILEYQNEKNENGYNVNNIQDVDFTALGILKTSIRLVVLSQGPRILRDYRGLLSDYYQTITKLLSELDN